MTLYNGDNYQQTRNNQWYTRNELRHDTFDVQNAKIAMDGFDFQRSDNSGAIGVRKPRISSSCSAISIRST